MPTTISGMTFYEEAFLAGVAEVYVENLDIFNASSGGSLVLTGGPTRGRQPSSLRLSAITNAIVARDPTSTSATVTPVVNANHEFKTVKLFRASAHDIRVQDWVDMGISSEVASLVYGRDFARQQIQDAISAGISALIGATSDIGATAQHDGSTATLTYPVLNAALTKVGDARDRIGAVLAHSKPLSDLIGETLSTATIAYQTGGLTMMTNAMPPLMGRQAIMTDSPGLYLAGGITAPDPDVDGYYTFALFPGALMIKMQETPSVISAPVIGDATTTPANHLLRVSINYEFELEVLNCSFTGSALPNNAALANDANWTFRGQNGVKAGPGVRILTR